MYLAGMIAAYKDELICDLAETYGVHDMYAFPADHIATLAVGLRDSSRVKMRLSDVRIDANTTLLAMIADNTALNIWLKTKDGQKGSNRPRSVLDILSGNDKKSETKGIKSGEEFMEEWRRING
jgi:hypothetical protein